MSIFLYTSITAILAINVIAAADNCLSALEVVNTLRPDRAARYRQAEKELGRGNITDAEALFQALAFELERESTNNNAALALVIVRSASVTHEQGRYDEAERLARRSLAILEDHHGKSSGIYAGVQSTLAE